MIIDLSVKLNSDTPAYPGDPKINIAVSETFEKDGCLGHSIAMGTHTGTHVDAPAHMISGGKTLDAFRPEVFVGRAVYVPFEDGTITLQQVKNTSISAGDIVLFDTGMAEKYYSSEYFTDYPVLTTEIVEHLITCGVKMVGVDTCSIDNTPDFPLHKLLLGNDILIIENITNVKALVGVDATVYALPLNFGLDASPARVFAEVHA